MCDNNYFKIPTKSTQTNDKKYFKHLIRHLKRILYLFWKHIRQEHTFSWKIWWWQNKCCTSYLAIYIFVYTMLVNVLQRQTNFYDSKNWLLCYNQGRIPAKVIKLMSISLYKLTWHCILTECTKYIITYLYEIYS
jgi:hypothetical protein